LGEVSAPAAAAWHPTVAFGANNPPTVGGIKIIRAHTIHVRCVRGTAGVIRGTGGLAGRHGLTLTPPAPYQTWKGPCPWWAQEKGRT
jgi:hypothetical protein